MGDILEVTGWFACPRLPEASIEKARGLQYAGHMDMHCCLSVHFNMRGHVSNTPLKQTTGTMKVKGLGGRAHRLKKNREIS